MSAELRFVPDNETEIAVSDTQPNAVSSSQTKPPLTREIL